VSLGDRIFAAMYDRMSERSEEAGLRARREALLSQASGKVLEIGAGTGRNLPYYGEDAELTLVEPGEQMARRLERRIDGHPRPVTLVRSPAEALPFPDGEFDVVVSTLVLCSVDDQAGALAEARRVLKPGGTLLFMEHLRSEQPELARLQDRMNRLNRVVARCDCNRSTLDAIRAAGFRIERVEHGELPKAPKFVRPLAVGAATPG
jgi:ubiquinone/menaquinone biosynthesis C-methylase UbiE